MSTLRPGTRLGPYDILALLGSGGMGEVYRARDERLGREVAVKVLLGEASADPDRIRRFEQEAKAAGALNHPNVLVVFDTGRHEDCPYVVFELLDGTTLDRQLGSGPLPVRTAVEYAVQIAQGLAAAHAQGIVHRDLKPGNLFVTQDGRVKILDFGLAKLRPTLDAGAPRQDGATVSAVTDAGVVLGTVGYMSPEQVKGNPADHRSDIFGFGSVLHEMLSGQRAFGGDTAAEVMTAILKKDPPALARPGIPPALERVVRRCLEKRPEKRFQSARDLAFALEELSQVADAVSVNGRGRRSTGRWVAAAAGLVIAASAALLLIRSRPWASAPTAGPKVVPLSSFPGREIDPALSPDGRQVAFAWDGGAPGGDFEIYVMLIAAGAPLRLTAQVGRDTNPSWSPDGRFVAFARAQGGETSLHLVPSLGGAERKLATLGLGALWYGLSIPTAWSPDGRSLVFPDRTSPDEPPGLYRLSLESLERRRITSPPRGALWDWGPAFAPDGTSLAFIRQGEGISRIYRVPVAGGEPALLTSDNVQALGGLGWTSDGRHVVFSSDRDGVWSLWRVPAQGGRAERLGIGQGSGSSVSSVSLQGDRSISLQGDRLAYVQSSDDQDIWRLDLTGAGGARAEPTKWISTTRFESAPQFSPDGARIAFESTRSGPMEIWTCRSDGSNPFQLTSLGTQWTGTPRWSPDGRQIAFDARPRGHSEILVVNAEGGTPRPVSSEGFNDWVPSWSRDGRWIYFGSDRSGRREVWKTPVGGGQAVQVTRNGGFAAFESPDGQSVYYSQFDAPGIFMVPVGGGEERRVLDGLSAGYWGYWAVVDTGLFFVDAAATPEPVLRFFDHASRRVATSSVLGRELNKFDSGLAVSPDGRWALYVRVDRRGSDLMLVENLQ